jgi:deoxyribodipyrimidine photo-lyase
MMLTLFPIRTHAELVTYCESLNAVAYGKTRNYFNGAVTKLSPYITHGVISTKEVIEILMRRYTIDQAEMLYKELLWREYFVQVHYRKGDAIFSDMEEDKTGIAKEWTLPHAIHDKTTSSTRVNQAILMLEQTGYLHNHIRMWLASYWTHHAKLHRKKLADRTYFYFLDGELGSNHLSRQRVQSTFSHKPYFMNEENLQRYRPGSNDTVYRGSYEDVEKRLFDTSRTSPYHNAPDTSGILQCDLSNYPVFEPSEWDHDTITVLSPWDRSPHKITHAATTVCILDTAFFARHPWSAQRLAFLQ